MSDLFASRGTADHLLARAAANSVDSFDDLSTPGFFTGLPSGTGLGVMRGGAKAATGLGVAAGGTIGAALDAPTFADLLDGEKPESTAARDAIFGATDSVGQSAIDFWTPRPNEVGRAGQVLGGLAEVALPLAATAGNPSLLVGSTTATAGKSLVDQGVDAGTAAPVAALEGLATYAGLKAPIVGKNLLTRMASGALGNVAVGSASRAAEKAALESQGYDEQAKMYAQDGESFSTDFLLGLLFGGVHHVGVGKPVNVEQNVPRDESSKKLGDLPVRGSGEGRAADLSVMPSDLSARLAEDAYPNLGAAEKVELQGLRERLQEAGKTDPATLPAVWKREIANASLRLRQALGGGLDVPTVPSGTAQAGDINPRLKPSEVDAILALRNTNHFARETAPGIPADTLAAAGHQSALETAINQLSRGEPVDVGAAVARHEGAQFADDGRIAENARLADQVTRNAGLDAPHAIEQRFQNRVENDLDGLMREYAALNQKDADSKGGRLLNTDIARELSPEYRADRTLSSTVHEPASALVKAMYAKKLTEAPGPGQDPVVVFSAGGTGAGKSAGLESAELSPIVDRAQIIYDTNLSTLDSAKQKIDQALAAGKDVQIVYTWREPTEALTAGALPRAQRMGRTVPLTEHAKTHVGAAKVIKQLEADYRDNPRVGIAAVDNSRGRGEARPMKVAAVPDLAYNGVREDLQSALEAERQAGRISPAVYRGTAERAAARRDAGAGDRGGTQPHASAAVRFDTGATPAPGAKFLVARLAKGGALENRNAANPQALAHFLARLDDADAARPAGAEKSDTVFVYEVTAPEKFSDYELGAKGRDVKGATIGRRQDRAGVVYSFPKGFDAEPALRIPLDEVRAETRAATGSDNFDDLGSRKGGEALQGIIEARLAKLAAESAPDGMPVSNLSLDEALAAEPGEQATPEIAALAQLVDENQDAQVLLGFDENGEPRRVTVSEALDEIRTEYEQAINDTKAYDAAISCFMGHG